MHTPGPMFQTALFIWLKHCTRRLKSNTYPDWTLSHTWIKPKFSKKFELFRNERNLDIVQKCYQYEWDYKFRIIFVLLLLSSIIKLEKWIRHETMHLEHWIPHLSNLGCLVSFLFSPNPLKQFIIFPHAHNLIQLQFQKEVFGKIPKVYQIFFWIR